MRTKILVLSIALALSANLHAQVSIGDLTAPAAGALLDLNKATKGGLALSNVDLANFYTIPNGFPGIVTQTDVTEPVKTAFKGAMVYNTGVTSPPAGIYVWNGTNWAPVEENCTPLTASNLTLAGLPFAKVNSSVSFSASANTSAVCSGGETYSWSVTPATNIVQTPSAANTSITFTATGTYKVKVEVTNRYSNLPAVKEKEVTVTTDGALPQTMLNSNYGLVGETCLDVMKPNTTGQDAAVYAARKAGFPGNNYEKTYKFIHTAAYSDLSLDYADPANLVEAITLDPPASAPAGGTAVDGYYEKEIKIKFRSNIQNLVPANGDSLTIQLVASYKPDGSNETKLAYLEIRVEDGTCVCPAKISATQWLNFACHNLGGEDILSPSQLITRAHHGSWYKFGAKDASLENTVANDSYVNDDATTGWPSKTYQNDSQDWLTANDPCPAGWRLPTNPEWAAAINKTESNGNLGSVNNELAWLGSWDKFNNFSSQLKVGDNLYLPAPGYRRWDSGMLYIRGDHGYYWSTLGKSSTGGIMYFSNGFRYVDAYNRSYGHSVRCVAAE